MSKSLLLMLCLVTGLLLLACARSDDTNRNVAAPSGTNSAAPAGTPVASTNSSTSTSAKIGVEECDAFLTAYENCVTTKVPEAARATYRTTLATWRAEWKKLADNPQTRGTLVGICKTSHESARTQLKAVGCTL